MLHYHHNNEWYEQPMLNIYHQSTFNALSMLAHSRVPSFLEIDGGYICSKAIYPKIKREHPKTVTYNKLLAKAGQEPLYKFLQLQMNLNISTNEITLRST